MGRKEGHSEQKEPQIKAPRQEKPCQFEEHRGGQWSFTKCVKGRGEGRGRVLVMAHGTFRFIPCTVESPGELVSMKGA